MNAPILSDLDRFQGQIDEADPHKKEDKDIKTIHGSPVMQSFRSENKEITPVFSREKLLTSQCLVHTT